MVDSHIHMALEPLKSNFQEIAERFITEGGKHILTQGTDMLDYDDTIHIYKELNKTNPSLVQLALGLHPTYFEETTIYRNIRKNLYEKAQKNIDAFEKVLLSNIDTVSAIGECGLDYYQMSFDQSTTPEDIEILREIQKLSFRKHLQIALKYNLPLSIHARGVNGNRECVKDVIRLVAEEGKGALTGSFHSYTGSIEDVSDILDLGFHIGFNAIITYKSGEDVREILKKVPNERILFETDGPFLPPQSVRKDKKRKEKFAEPTHIKEIISTAAEVKDIDTRYLEELTDENYQNLFL